MIGLSVIGSVFECIVSAFELIVSFFKYIVIRVRLSLENFLIFFKRVVIRVRLSLFRFLMSFRLFKGLLAAYFIFVSSFKNKRLRFSDRDIDRKERMVQLYIVLMGLLLTYFKLAAFGIGLFIILNLFVVGSIFYYSSLSSFMESGIRVHLNLLALCIAFSFRNDKNIISSISVTDIVFDDYLGK